MRKPRQPKEPFRLYLKLTVPSHLVRKETLTLAYSAEGPMSVLRLLRDMIGDVTHIQNQFFLYKEHIKATHPGLDACPPECQYDNPALKGEGVPI